MYKPFLYCFLLYLLGSTGVAQNLIYNGDFEIYDTCPNNYSEIQNCNGWYAPTLGTSDYFNACSQGTVSVPNTIFGFQQAKSGYGYAGLYAFIDFICEYREYIQTKLIQPLKQGATYRLSFYVSLAYSQAAVEKIGALFTSNQISRIDDCPIFALPQIVNQNGFLKDTLEWMKIEGEFISSGGEEYITIGYFEDTINSSNLVYPLLPDSITLGYFNIYYFIDGISLELVLPNVFTPNGDGINDLFKIDMQYEIVKIYNRWGNILFETTDRNLFWDGKNTLGNNTSEGVYFYHIKMSDGHIKTGYVQLLR